MPCVHDFAYCMNEKRQIDSSTTTQMQINIQHLMHIFMFTECFIYLQIKCGCTHFFVWITYTLSSKQLLKEDEKHNSFSFNCGQGVILFEFNVLKNQLAQKSVLNAAKMYAGRIIYLWKWMLFLIWIYLIPLSYVHLTFEKPTLEKVETITHFYDSITCQVMNLI